MRIFHIRLFLLTIISISCLGSELDAQRGPELGGYIGMSQYFGELNSQPRINDPGYALGAIYRHNFDDRISAKAMLSHILLRGDDANSSNAFEFARMANFSSRVWEISLSGEFNFFSFIHGRKEYKFTPYLTGGFSYLSFNSKGETPDGNTIDLSSRDIEEANYASHTPAMTLGGGIKYSLNHRWLLNMEIAYRYTFNDYIDDVSTVFPDTGRQRGNPNDKDRYAVIQIGLLRYFGSLRCPSISNNAQPKKKKKKKRRK